MVPVEPREELLVGHPGGERGVQRAVGCAELGHHRRGAPGPADDQAPVHPLGDLGVAVGLRGRIGQLRLPRVGAEAVDVERRDDLSAVRGRGHVRLRRCGVGEVGEQGLLLPPQGHLGCRGPDGRRDLGVAGADGRIEIGAVADQALQRRTAREGLVDQLEADDRGVGVEAVGQSGRPLGVGVDHAQSGGDLGVGPPVVPLLQGTG